MFDRNLLETLEQARVIPVIVLENPEHGVPLAQAFLGAGLHVMEITFRAKGAARAIRAIRTECPEMMVGAGTLISTDQVKAAFEAGASFGVAPGCRPPVVETAMSCNLSFAPGIMTPTDVELALGLGCRVLKFFPAESAGGLSHLKSLSAPYRHLELRYIPTGGIDAEKARAYLALPDVPAVGGSWLAPPEWIRGERWAEIGRRVSESLAELKG